MLSRVAWWSFKSFRVFKGSFYEVLGFLGFYGFSLGSFSNHSESSRVSLCYHVLPFLQKNVPFGASEVTLGSSCSCLGSFWWFW